VGRAGLVRQQRDKFFGAPGFEYLGCSVDDGTNLL
jgi:hypothetical protein